MSCESKTGWPVDAPLLDVATMQALPRISIVTPSYNQGNYIEETICSILSQEYPKLEYIVIDGGSSDRSVEIIRRYASDLTYWVSEKDRGQSHAINKGLSRCTGDIFNWINSDDLLRPGALWAVAKAWMQRPGGIISGPTEFFDGRGTFAIAGARGQTLQNFVRFWEASDWEWAQQGTFLPCARLRALGGVDEKLCYCMDYQIMVRLLMEGTEVSYVEQPLARFRSHDNSKTVGAREQFRLERVPMLRAIKGLPVAVTNAEWNRQQARRLLDVAIGAARGGSISRGARLLTRAVSTSPVGAAQELFSRCFLRTAKAT